MMRLDEMQDLFEQFIPSQFKDFYYSGIVTPLTKRDSQGRLILLGRLGRWKVDEYDFDQALAASIVLFNYCAAKSIKTQHCGVVAVLDFRGWNLQQMLGIKIGRLKIAVKLMQDSCPAKIKGFHILHHPRLVKVLYFLLTPFLKKKLRSRIHFHSDESSLHELIGPDIIPATSEAVAQNSYFDEKMITDLLSEDKYNLDMVTFGYPSC
ncbi:Retinaldehyde-binding protein 1 [Orchesella cincta]|uniref:Retinaldehyde-binding protein 1 n=1 Tax=Orchesella cincta TaxID=48709 RepID=A0A1D2MIC9_ORCCI|nr:Retinaldehyde-binding protein 1 [Orchesella cincta]